MKAATSDRLVRTKGLACLTEKSSSTTMLVPAKTNYLMKYNCETNLYDVYIDILDGSATTIPQRAQFNSQISFVVPTGESISIVDNYMPLQNNQQYEGTVPLEWLLGTGKISPEEQPESDFYAVTPVLSPASFYNDLNEGDLVHLFSISVGDSEQFDERVRFFNNNNDPDFSEPGQGDFSNGFTLGGATQLYVSNSYENCLTNTFDTREYKIQSFPNPCIDYLTIESEEEVIDITIIGIDSKVYFQNDMIYSKNVSVQTSHFPKGLYYLIIESNSNTTTQKIIKI